MSSDPKRPAGYRPNAWRSRFEPPISRGTLRNWELRGLVEVSRIGDVTLILTDPDEFAQRFRCTPPQEPDQETAAAEPQAELEAPADPEAPPVKRGRGRPKGSKNRPGHNAGRPPRRDPEAPQPLAAAPGK